MVTTYISTLLRSRSCKGLPNMTISFVLIILHHFNTPLKRCKSKSDKARVFLLNLRFVLSNLAEITGKGQRTQHKT